MSERKAARVLPQNGGGTRRQFLGNLGMGLSQIAALSLLQSEGKLLGAPYRPALDRNRPFYPRVPPGEPRADNVIVIFCAGALSQVDTWDYKPALIRYHDQPLPDGESVVTFQSESANLQQSPWAFQRYGQTGKWVSDLVPHLGALSDELCFIHSLTSRTNTHGPGETFMNTGYTLEGYPSVGSWVTYALGSEAAELPAFVAIPDSRGVPQSGATSWSAGFLPGVFQGVPFNAVKPIRHLSRPKEISADEEGATRAFLQRLNQRHQRSVGNDDALTARMASYELAGRMQLSVPQLTQLADEPNHVLRLYGADDAADPLKASFAANCILARRLVERGVRFVQLFNGGYGTAQPGDTNWDAHDDLARQYAVHGRVLDQPVAGLLRDLRQRGLLDRTLVLLCTEFGRMPFFQKNTQGRDHNPSGFTAWLTGAGVRSGLTYGATDELGFRAVQAPTTVYDLHATLLHLLGIDHERLTVYHNGREQRLTDVHGHVIRPILRAS